MEKQWNCKATTSKAARWKGNASIRTAVEGHGKDLICEAREVLSIDRHGADKLRQGLVMIGIAKEWRGEVKRGEALICNGKAA